MTLLHAPAVQRRAGWGAVMGGLCWLVKGCAILLTGVQPSYLFEAAPFFLGVGLWGLYLRLSPGQRGRAARAGAILALAAAVSAPVQLWAGLFAPELVPREDTVTMVTPFVVLAGLGVLAGAALLGVAVWRVGAIPLPWLPLSIPLVFVALMIASIFLEGLMGKTLLSGRLLEVPVVILGVAWMWLGAMILRPATFSSRGDRDG